MNNLNKTLEMNRTKHTTALAVKSVAFATGFITLNDADRIHDVLGNAPADFNRQPLAVKLAVINALTALLKAINGKEA
jgi:hypothetical protein